MNFYIDGWQHNSDFAIAVFKSTWSVTEKAWQGNKYPWKLC